jgi:NAD(P)-dependent dehydrogenase (short-subunit alcohol dehydrogenase family)
MAPVDDGQGTVLVVGGAGAIGTAVVRAYRGRGVDVIVIDETSLPTATAANGVDYIRADVTDDDDMFAARAHVASLDRRVRHVVSLAGGAMDTEFGAFTDTSVATIRASLELNLTSHVLLTRAFVPLLDVDGDRSVTLISSINALRDYGLPTYSAAKAGMIGFARGMATELGAQGIRINVVVPGTVVTGPSTQPKDFDGLRRGSALGRLAVPDDIAAAVMAVSHDLRAMTGQLLVIDCGQTVATPPWRLDADDDEEG